MQNVSFFIMRHEQGKWKDVILEIERHGHEVVFEPVDSELTFVLSGAYANPMIFSGKTILVTHPASWGIGWDVLYKNVILEYYDAIYDISTMSFDYLMNLIGGEIEAAESRSKD